MENFFKSLSEILENEGDKITLIIQKTGEELTTSTILKVNKIESSFIATGFPEELDDNYFGELQKPKEKIRTFKSTADSAEVTESEEEEEESEDNGKYKGGKKAPKKATTKKQASKKEDTTSVPAPKECDVEANNKAEEEAAKVKEEEEARNKLEQEKKDKFEKYMSDGKQEFDARKYEDAEISFQKAIDLFPDNNQAAEHFKQAKNWVDRLIESKVIPARKEAQ